MQVPNEQQSRISRSSLFVFVMTSVRLFVFIVLPIAAAVICWMAWPNYKPRFNQLQLARGISIPLSSVDGWAIPASRRAEPSTANDAQRERIIDPFWLAADTTPELYCAGEIEEKYLSGQIAGIELDGCHFAFAIDGMKNPYYSLVTVASQHRQATVTHCPKGKLTRVFVAGRSPKSPLLALAGVMADGEFMLAVDGKCFAQIADNFPMEELAHRTMALGDWLHLHPNSMCYLGGLLVSYVDRPAANALYLRSSP